MSEPEGDELWLKPESLSLGVRNAREVLEADEGGTSAIDYELAGVGCADTNHQYDVDIRVVVEKRAALVRCGASKRHDVGPLEHGTKVRAVCQGSKLHYIAEMRPVRVEDVVMPIRLEETAMGFEVAMVGSDAISAIEYCEKVR
jgi:hypothetical protein